MVLILVFAMMTTTTICHCGPYNPSEIYSPCIVSYSGFIGAPRQDPNSSIADFTISEGSTAYLTIKDNVSKGLNQFIDYINGSWTIYKPLNSTSSLLFLMYGSNITSVQYVVLNEFPVKENSKDYYAGVLVLLNNYTLQSG